MTLYGYVITIMIISNSNKDVVAPDSNGEVMLQCGFCKYEFLYNSFDVVNDKVVLLWTFCIENYYKNKRQRTLISITEFPVFIRLAIAVCFCR